MNTAVTSDEESRATQGDRQGGAIGAALRTARTRRNLQVEQVAKELHLDARVINAIENDDRAALPEPIFVQGYLRAYARLVGLSGDELVSRYCAQGAAPPPLSVIGPRRKKPLVPLPSARLVRYVILVVLAGILVWLAYPLAERMIQRRTADAELQLPGISASPPGFEEEPPPDAAR
jgi:cytoskeleton protein RodZ